MGGRHKLLAASRAVPTINALLCEDGWTYEAQCMCPCGGPSSLASRPLRPAGARVSDSHPSLRSTDTTRITSQTGPQEPLAAVPFWPLPSRAPGAHRRTRMACLASARPAVRAGRSAGAPRPAASFARTARRPASLAPRASSSASSDRDWYAPSSASADDLLELLRQRRQAAAGASGAPAADAPRCRGLPDCALACGHHRTEPHSQSQLCPAAPPCSTA